MGSTSHALPRVLLAPARVIAGIALIVLLLSPYHRQPSRDEDSGNKADRQSLPARPDPAVVEALLREKLTLGTAWFRAGKFDEMDAIYPQLLAGVNDSTYVLPNEKTK
jgi:hypothetical protein